MEGHEEFDAGFMEIRTCTNCGSDRLRKNDRTGKLHCLKCGAQVAQVGRRWFPDPERPRKPKTLFEMED